MTDDFWDPPAGEGTRVTTDPTRILYDWSVTSPSTAVVSAVAATLDCDPETLDPLYESIDPDAFDAVVQSGRASTPEGNITVSFTYAAHQVTVHATGEVIVRAPDGDR